MCLHSTASLAAGDQLSSLQQASQLQQQAASTAAGTLRCKHCQLLHLQQQHYLQALPLQHHSQQLLQLQAVLQAALHAFPLQPLLLLL
jgi:hypothetical protein